MWSSTDLLSVEVATRPDGLVVVSVRGEVDIATAPELAAGLEGVVRASPRAVVVDLSGVSFMDSSGVNRLVSAARTLMADGARVVLAVPGPLLRRVFDVTRVADVVPVEPSLEAALRLAAGTDPDDVSAHVSPVA